jgi:nucleotide-binding universal stress UspA family protein
MDNRPILICGLREILDGSLSHQVAEHAGRPVLIVPAPHDEQ